VLQEWHGGRRSARATRVFWWSRRFV